jgi:hypothetical protein
VVAATENRAPAGESKGRSELLRPPEDLTYSGSLLKHQQLSRKARSIQVQSEALSSSYTCPRTPDDGNRAAGYGRYQRRKNKNQNGEEIVFAEPVEQANHGEGQCRGNQRPHD